MSAARSPSRKSAQQQENRSLRQLILQRRDAQWPFGAIRLGDVVPSHRRRDVTARQGIIEVELQIKVELQVRLIVRRHHAVDAGRAILACQTKSLKHPLTVDQVKQRGRSDVA